MILFAYLVNMAVGTWIADQLIGRVNLRRILSWFVSLALIFILPSLFLHKIMEIQGLQRYYFVFDPVATAFENNIIFVVKCILLSVILLLPVLFVSGIFPTMVRARAEGGVNTGQAFSYIYFVQTLGNAAGALVTGFILFGVIGAQGTLALLAVLLVLLFLFAPFPNAKIHFGEKVMPVIISAVVLSCLLFYNFNDSIKWPHGGKVLQETPYDVRESVHGMTYFYDIGSQQGEIYSAQASGKFHITSIPGENFLGGETLYGHAYASTEALAYSVKPDIRKILFIGIGTAQELVTFKVLFKDAEVTVVELNPELVDFMYEHSHKDIIETLNEYKVVVNDGRRYMQQLPEDEKFDYIHIGVDRASTTGAGNLFSREFIQKVHDRLNPDGVATFYGYPPVVNAAVDIYEDFAAFAPKSGIVVFLGSNTKGFVSKAIDSGEFAKNFAEAVSILSDKNGSAFIGDTKLTGLRESGWYMKKEQIEELFSDINVTATDNLLATEYYINQETELQPQRMRTAFPLGLRKWIDVEDKVQPFPFPNPNAQIEYTKETVLELNNSADFRAIKFIEGEVDLLSTTDFSESGSVDFQYPTILQIRGERDRLWKWQVGEALDVSEDKDMAYRLVLDADKDGRGIWGTLIECTDTEGNVIARTHEETSTQNEDRVTALQDLGEVESANLCHFYLTFYSSVGWNKISSFALKSVAIERYSY
jgi:spermidine synthase